MYKHEGNQLGQLTEPEAVANAHTVWCRSRSMAMMCSPCMWLPVQGSDPVPNSSARFGATPNPNLNHRSGSAPTPNPGPNLGPVREGSGPDQSSEPNYGNPTCDDTCCVTCTNFLCKPLGHCRSQYVAHRTCMYALARVWPHSKVSERVLYLYVIGVYLYTGLHNSALSPVVLWLSLCNVNCGNG